jgi:DNA adenine methylase
MNIQKTQKPFKTYLGGKESSGVYQTIINNIPKHKTLIIPFLGNCAIYRNIKRADNTILIDADPEIVKAWCTIIKNDNGSSARVILICDDAISYLQQHHKQCDDQETFIYCDPPYPIETRSSKNTKYKFDFTNEDHISLLTVLRDLNCRVAISTYPNELYTKMLFGWNYISFKSKTRAGLRTELLYMNYNINELELHDYSYLGKNFRQRERIKKKIQRYSSRLMRLDRMEALAILEKLAAVNIKNGVTVRNIINVDGSSSTNYLNRASNSQAMQTVFPSKGFLC